MAQSYSEDEAEAILKLASREAFGERVSRERLLATAQELGISPEAVEEAERSIRETNHDLSLRAEFDRKRRNCFLNKIAGLLGSAVLLCGINYLTAHEIDWAYWLLLFWGYELVKSGWSAFGDRGEEYEEAFAEWKKERTLSVQTEPQAKPVGLTPTLTAEARVRIGGSGLD